MRLIRWNLNRFLGITWYMNNKIFIKHNISSEVFVPISAISSWDFLHCYNKSSDEILFTFSNGESKILDSYKEINILSQEGIKLSYNLYKINSTLLLIKWFKLLKGNLNELTFFNLKFKDE